LVFFKLGFILKYCSSDFRYADKKYNAQQDLGTL